MAKKQKKSNRIWVRIFLIVFAIVVVADVAWQYQRYEVLQEELSEINQQIAEEKKKATDFEARKEYYNSDAYIEQIAREKLGLVKSNEILYINRAE